MAENGDMQSWAKKEGLSDAIVFVLEEEGFTSVEQIKSTMQPDDVKAYFQDTKLLKVAQCLALKKAVTKLTGALSGVAVSPPGNTATAPTPAAPVQNPDYPPRNGAPPPVQSPDYPPHNGAPPPVQSPHYPPRNGAPPPHQHHHPGHSHPAPAAAPGYPHSHHPYPGGGGFGGGHPTAAPYPTQPHQFSSQPQPYAAPYGGQAQSYPSAAQHASSLAAFVGPDGVERYTLLLLGKTGSGKSTTGNTIFGRQLFNTAATFSSVTTACERQTSQLGNRKIEIIDSPGLYDTHKTQEEICVTIVSTVAGMHPGPHAVLYVVRLGRFTAEEFGAYQRLKALFDGGITRYMIVVFTHGDMLEREGRSIEEVVQRDSPETLRQVLAECGNRYMVFNNMARDPRPQTEQLLAMARRVVAENGSQPYSCPKYHDIGQGMEQEVAARLLEVEKRDLKRQKYVQQLEKKTQEAQETAQKTQQQMEENEKERQRKMEEEGEKRRQLEERMQEQTREQQEIFQKQQEEMERLRRQREEQEREMREKEHEMTERDRKRAEEEAERTRQREQEMNELMTQQAEVLARQREEDEQKRQAAETERQVFMQELEEQRRRDTEELRLRNEEREKLMEERMEEEKAAAKIREERYQQEMNDLKQKIVDNEATDYIASAISTIAHVVKLGFELILTANQNTPVGFIGSAVMGAASSMMGGNGPSTPSIGEGPSSSVD